MVEITYDRYNQIADLFYEGATDQEIKQKTNASNEEIAYVKHMEGFIL